MRVLSIARLGFVLLLLASSGALCETNKISAQAPEIQRGEKTSRQPIENDAYEFAKSFIQSLGWSKSALSRYPDLDSHPATDRASMTIATREFMLGNKLAVEDLKKAASEVSGFKQSKRDGIRESASATLTAYMALIKLYQQLNAEIQSFLDTKPQKGLGSTLNSQTDLLVNIEKAWELLDYAAVGVTHAILFLPQEPNEPVTTLDLTAKQRNDLCKTLLSSFGNKVKKSSIPDEDRVSMAARLLYEFLANDQWKTRQ